MNNNFNKDEMPTMFHHVAYSVRNIEATENFYSLFDFKRFRTWKADNNSLEIIHLKNANDFILELFCFSENIDANTIDIPLNKDLERVGIKHIALRVENIISYREWLLEKGMVKENIEIKKGRTGVFYFFISDPDGGQVEIVQDDSL